MLAAFLPSHQGREPTGSLLHRMRKDCNRRLKHYGLVWQSQHRLWPQLLDGMSKDMSGPWLLFSMSCMLLYVLLQRHCQNSGADGSHGPAGGAGYRRTGRSARAYRAHRGCGAYRPDRAPGNTGAARSYWSCRPFYGGDGSDRPAGSAGHHRAARPARTRWTHWGCRAHRPHGPAGGFWSARSAGSCRPHWGCRPYGSHGPAGSTGRCRSARPAGPCRPHRGCRAYGTDRSPGSPGDRRAARPAGSHWSCWPFFGADGPHGSTGCTWHYRSARSAGAYRPHRSCRAHRPDRPPGGAGHGRAAGSDGSDRSRWRCRPYGSGRSHWRCRPYGSDRAARPAGADRTHRSCGYRAG